MSGTRLTVEERSALLRAARLEISRLKEVVRLQNANGLEGSWVQADVDAAALAHLTSAVRKLWVASGG